MQKTILLEEFPHFSQDLPFEPLAKWLDLPSIISRIEVTSEDILFPVEHALTHIGVGWRAGKPGTQTIRLHFEPAQNVHRIHVCCFDRNYERMQEVEILAATTTLPLHELRRLNWNFNPYRTVKAVEEFTLHLNNVTLLELRFNPDVRNPNSDRVAMLHDLKIG